MSLLTKAYHEAGHAVVGHLLGGRVERLSLRDSSVYIQSNGETIDHLAVASWKMAGPIAEWMHKEERAPSDAELRQVLRMEKALAELGCSDYHTARPPLVVLKRHRCSESRFIYKAAQRARWLLRRNWRAVEAVRKASMRREARGTLDRSRIVTLIEHPRTERD